MIINHQRHRWIYSLPPLFLFTLISTPQALAKPDALYVAGSHATQAEIPGSLPLFIIFASLTLISGLVMVTRRNPLVAAISLVGTLICTACLFLMLHASFLAAIQILVYAGAVMVLFIFVVMTVARPDQEELGFGQGTIIKVFGLGFLILFLVRLISTILGPEVKLSAQSIPAHFGTAQGMSELLFSKYLFPFEAITLLLLVAIIGAVVLTRTPPKNRPVETQKGEDL